MGDWPARAGFLTAIWHAVLTSLSPPLQLYKAADEWVTGLHGRRFNGGTQPNLADLAVFGVVRSVTGTGESIGRRQQQQRFHCTSDAVSLALTWHPHLLPPPPDTFNDLMHNSQIGPWCERMLPLRGPCLK